MEFFIGNSPWTDAYFFCFCSLCGVFTNNLFSHQLCDEGVQHLLRHRCFSVSPTRWLCRDYT